MEVTGKCFPKKLLWELGQDLDREKKEEEQIAVLIFSVLSGEEPLIQNRMSLWSLLSKLEILEEPLHPLGLSSLALE